MKIYVELYGEIIPGTSDPRQYPWTKIKNQLKPTELIMAKNLKTHVESYGANIPGISGPRQYPWT